MFEANSGNVVVTVGRSRDVNHIRLSISQEFRQVAEIAFHSESFEELPCHQRLPVINAHNLTSPDTLNLRSVHVCYPAASDDGDLKHAVFFPCSFQNRGVNPLPCTPLASNPAASSSFCRC